MPKPKAKSKAKTPGPKKPALAPAERRWDVVIWELATKKVSAVIGTDLRESGSFHTVDKRVATGYDRINEAFSIAKVPPGKYQPGSTLSDEDAKPA